MGDIDALKLRRLDFTLLLVLEAALRLRKFTAVAQALGLTQPAVSHAVARLRGIFGDELFVRRPAGVMPTARALALAAPVTEALRLMSGALRPQAPFDPAHMTRTFRIGSPDHETALFLPGLTAAAAQSPRIAYAVRSLTRRAALSAVETGDLDLALGYFWDLPASISTQAIFQERYAVVARKDFAPKRAWTLPAYAARDHVLMSIDGGTRGIVDDALAKAGIARRVVAAAPYFFAVFAAVAASRAVATVPRRLALRFAPGFGLMVMEPPLPLRGFAVSAAWSRRNDSDPGLSWLRDRLLELAASWNE